MSDSIVPKVFISYSWDDEPHKKWVKDLASRLRHDGVDTTLDRWAVVPGGQLPEFMERSVRENDFVLIICTPRYKTKSDNRSGGVGYEGDIMTGEVLVFGNDEKFIPLFRQGDWEDSAPSWLMGKYRIDFRGEPYSKESYSELIECLFSSREKAPPLGTAKILRQQPNSLILRYSDDAKDFSLWLSLQLINNGYRVWCDLLNPEPGEYKDSEVKDSIRNRAIKFLYVLSSKSNIDPDLLKELRFAYEAMQHKKLVGFVVPLQLTNIPETDRNILLQGTSPIDFSASWAKGINDLFAYLERNNIPKDSELTPFTVNEIWRQQFDPDQNLKEEVEELVSNWFPIQLPKSIYFHELQRSGIGPLEVQEKELPFPALQHSIYLVTFAEAEDLVKHLEANISFKSTKQIDIQEFFAGNYDQKLVQQEMSWNLVSELLNDAWYRYFTQTKLKTYTLANNRLCFYFAKGFSDKGDNKSYFIGIDGQRTWRSLVGKHKNSYWHFGVQGRAALSPEPVYIIKSHVLASDDGINIWTSKDRLHAARRRWSRNWWNAEWRDKLSAAMCFLATAEGVIEIPLGSDVTLNLLIEPLVFQSPVKYIDSRDLIKSETDDETESILEDDIDDDMTDDEFEEDVDL